MISRSGEADTWKVLRIPMEADTDDDPIGRKFGERLWPEHYREEDIEDAKQDPLLWACSFQQTPLSDEGDWLSPEDLPVIRPSKLPTGLVTPEVDF